MTAIQRFDEWYNGMSEGEKAVLTFSKAFCEGFMIGVFAQSPEIKVGSVLQEAEQIINGPRRDSYGPVEESFAKVASGWNAITGASITPRHVALMMIWLKTVRDANKSQRDNLTDIAGYAGLADKLS